MGSWDWRIGSGEEKGHLYSDLLGGEDDYRAVAIILT